MANPDLPGSRQVVLAAVISAHGLAGEVRLKLFGEGASGLKRYRAFSYAGGSLTVTSLRDDGKGGAIARFVEIADRTAAEKLRGSVLTVPRSAMPALAPGEYYHADLLGGEGLGTVVAVENFGAGDIIEIERPDKKRFMVPLKPEAVPEWDEARVLVADGWAEG